MSKILTFGEQKFLRKPCLLVLVIFLLGTAIFLPTVGFDFLWDDALFIKNNSFIKSIENWPRFLLSYVYVGQDSVFYRPTVLFSLSVDYLLFKGNPWGFHLTNSLLNGLNASLVAYLAWLLFQNPYGALAAGALFALHPAHPEAVAFLSARADLLYTLFSLLALIALVKKPKTDKSWGPLVFAPLFFLLALLSKETAVVILIPMALWLYQPADGNPHKLRAVLLKIMPSILMAILYLSLRSLVLQSILKKKLVVNYLYSPFMLFELFLRYMSFLIFPTQQVSYLYNAPGRAYPLDIKFWLFAGLTLLLLGAITYLIYRRRETAPFFALIILPCLPSLLFALGVDIIMIDRYLYLPTAGLALLAAWGLMQVPKGWEKRVAFGMVLLLGLYGGATLWRTPLWKNEVTLYEAFKKEYPASPYIRANLGVAYHNTNRLLEANQEISEAIKLDPLDFRYRNNFGRLCLNLGWIPQARAAFFESLRLAPNNAPALEGMGLSYVLAGDYDTALKYLDLALLVDPKNETALKNKTAVLARIQALKKVK